MGTIFGAAAGVVLLYAIFLLPFLYRRLVMEDWTLKTWEIIKGPLLWRRGPVPEVPEGHVGSVIQDYYRGHNYGTPNTMVPAGEAPPVSVGTVDMNQEVKGEVPTTTGGGSASSLEERHESKTKLSMEDMAKLKSQEYPAKTLKGFFARAKYYFFRGVDRDIVEEQSASKPKGFAASFLTKDLSKIHLHVPHYDNKTEHLYSFLQV